MEALWRDVLRSRLTRLLIAANAAAIVAAIALLIVIGAREALAARDDRAFDCVSRSILHQQVIIRGLAISVGVPICLSWCLLAPDGRPRCLRQRFRP